MIDTNILVRGTDEYHVHSFLRRTVALAAMARPSSSQLDRQSPQAARSLLKALPQGSCFATLVTPLRLSTKTLRHGESEHRALCMSRGEDGRMIGSGRDSAHSALQRAIKILQDGGIPESSASAEVGTTLSQLLFVNAGSSMVFFEMVSVCAL